MMRTKKAQFSLGQLPVAILGLATIIIVLSIAGLMVGNIRDTSPDYVQARITNESWVTSKTASVQLAHDDIVGESEIVGNSTAATGLCRKTGNYTIDYGQGKIICLAGSICCGGTLNISYDWRYFGGSWNASQSGLAGINTFSEQMPVIAIIIVMGLVLMILLGVFGSFLKNR